MDITGATQSLTGRDAPRGVLSRVMNQQDRQIELPLQRTKVRQQLGHLAGMILIDAVKPHQGIENEQPGPEPPGCLKKPGAVPIVIEPECRRGDHVDFHSVTSRVRILVPSGTRCSSRNISTRRPSPERTTVSSDVASTSALERTRNSPKTSELHWMWQHSRE